MQRVAAVDVLNLLSSDGPYAQLVQDLLDASDVWAAYKDRKHDLYLPAAANPQVLCCLPLHACCSRWSCPCWNARPAAAPGVLRTALMHPLSPRRRAWCPC